MKYREVDIELSAESIEPLLAILGAHCIDNVEVDDPRDAEEIMRDKEKYEWDYVDEKFRGSMDRQPVIRIYVEDGENAEREISNIEASVSELTKNIEGGLYGDVSASAPKINVVMRDDEDWKYKWKEYFKPKKVSDRIVVKPTWEDYQKEPDEIVIELDPGMAFGTGTHETTSMCISLLDRYVEEGDVVLDAGCGSGILSIATAKLGAVSVLGIDIDSEAVRVSKENFVINGVSDIADAKLLDISNGIGMKADIVVANLMAELVAGISNNVKDILESDGIFISSGILYEKEEMVEEALEKAGFDVIDGTHEGEWVALVATPAE